MNLFLSKIDIYDILRTRKGSFADISAAFLSKRNLAVMSLC